MRARLATSSFGYASLHCREPPLAPAQHPGREPAPLAPTPGSVLGPPPAVPVRPSPFLPVPGQSELAHATTTPTVTPTVTPTEPSARPSGDVWVWHGAPPGPRPPPDVHPPPQQPRPPPGYYGSNHSASQMRTVPRPRPRPQPQQYVVIPGARGQQASTASVTGGAWLAPGTITGHLAARPPRLNPPSNSQRQELALHCLEQLNPERPTPRPAADGGTGPPPAVLAPPSGAPLAAPPTLARGGHDRGALPRLVEQPLDALALHHQVWGHNQSTM